MLLLLMDHVTEDETSLSVSLCGKHTIRAWASANPRAVIEHVRCNSNVICFVLWCVKAYGTFSGRKKSLKNISILIC